MVSFFNRRVSDKRKPYDTSALVAPGMDAVDMRTAGAVTSDDLIIPNYDVDNTFGGDLISEARVIETAHASKSQKNLPQNTPPKNNMPKNNMPQNTPQVFAFIGASGGVGTTSLAVQIAHELAAMCKDKKANTRRPKDPQVCLIDLDFEGGACAYHLDLLPSLSVEDLSGGADRIDTTFTSALVSTHQCGVSLLAVPNTPNANQSINPHAVMAMLDAASQLYRYVVIDMPRYAQSWTPAVMGGADFVGILSELTISSLHMARETLTRATADFADNAPENLPNCHAILSKYERRSFKNTLRLNDAETVLGRSVIGTICVDSDTCREAINCGEPVGAIRPDNRYVKDSRQLIQKMLMSCTQHEIAAPQIHELQAAHKAA